MLGRERKGQKNNGSTKRLSLKVEANNLSNGTKGVKLGL